MVNEQREQAEQLLLEAVSMEQISAQRTQASSSPTEEQSEWVQVGRDGGWLPSREQKGGIDQQNRDGGQSGRSGWQTRATSTEPVTLCGHIWSRRRPGDADLCSNL